jgi:hypothetical protein
MKPNSLIVLHGWTSGNLTEKSGNSQKKSQIICFILIIKDNISSDLNYLVFKSQLIAQNVSNIQNRGRAL